jgi:hypothetical protein
MGSDNSPSFLDLPRELRDMIYVYVCDDMRHEGYGWRKTGEHSNDESIAEGRRKTVGLQNCAIMRTCRQVHWEFAKVFYAQPLQLTGISWMTRSHLVVAGSHIIPLSVTYAHLVRKLAVIHSTDLHDFHGLNFVYKPLSSATIQWRDIITAATQLVKLFPAIKTLRVLYEIKEVHFPDQTWESMIGKCGATREEQVETAERFINAVRLSDSRKMKIPLQLELLHIDNGTLVETPWGKALKNVQAAELRKRGRKRKLCS